MKIYVDGEEYEPTETGKYMLRNAFEVLFKPVKVEPKWEVRGPHNLDNYSQIIVHLPHPTAIQAQLIKESVEDLMVFIMGELTFMDLNAANKARQSLSKYDG